MTRISNRVRAEAAEALLCCASGRGRGMAEFIIDYADGYLVGGGGAYGRATELATSAFHAVTVATDGHGSSEDTCLEAAGLLLDGWNPGERVKRKAVR